MMVTMQDIMRQRQRRQESWRDALQSDVRRDKVGNPFHVVELELRQRSRHLAVARHRDNMGILRMQQRLANHAAVHLELAGSARA